MKNLQKIFTSKLRNSLAEVLERVAIGRQSFIVSKFGRVKAMIVPIQSKDRLKEVEFSQLKAFGIWQGRTEVKNVADWISRLRLRQSKRKGSLLVRSMWVFWN